MKLTSPNFPELDDVEGAIVYYYVDRKHSTTKIAQFLGLPYSTVYRILLRAGVDIRKVKGTKTTAVTEGAKTRECKGCAQEYPLTSEYWHKELRAAGGFKYYCKRCRAAGMGR